VGCNLLPYGSLFLVHEQKHFADSSGAFFPHFDSQPGRSDHRMRHWDRPFDCIDSESNGILCFGCLLSLQF
jgi:hypothetical protein